jgi:hypothetical protein
MKPQDYSETMIELAGWSVRLTTYKLGGRYISKADNVSPGANFAKAEGSTKEEAESRVMEIAQRRLGRTKTMPI